MKNRQTTVSGPVTQNTPKPLPVVATGPETFQLMVCSAVSVTVALAVAGAFAAFPNVIDVALLTAVIVELAGMPPDATPGPDGP